MSFDVIEEENNNLINTDNNVEYIERLDSNNNNSNNNNESILIAEAIIQEKELKTIVNENKDKDQLRNKGFGEIFNQEYILSGLETLYLLSNNKIKLVGKKEYDFSSLLKMLLKKD